MTNNDMTAVYMGVSAVTKICLGEDVVWPPTPQELTVTYRVNSTSENVRIVTQISSSNYKAEFENGTEISLPSVGWKDTTFPATGNQKVIFTAKTTKRGIPSFDSCAKITAVYIPEGFTKIGMDALKGCSLIETINIPNSVTGITDGNNFTYCTGLREVNIGTGLKEFGAQVFMGCSNLTAVTINAVTPPTIGTDVLASAPNAYFYVPDEAVAAYQANSRWAPYASRVKGISEKPQ